MTNSTGFGSEKISLTFPEVQAVGREIVFDELKCSDESNLRADSSLYESPRAYPMSSGHGIPLEDGPSENSDWVPLPVS